MVTVNGLSRRNRVHLRMFELRSNMRFGLARVRRLDWPAAAHATLAAFAVVGGCHAAAHTAEFRGRTSAPARPSAADAAET